MYPVSKTTNQLLQISHFISQRLVLKNMIDKEKIYWDATTSLMVHTYEKILAQHKH